MWLTYKIFAPVSAIGGSENNRIASWLKLFIGKEECDSNASLCQIIIYICTIASFVVHLLVFFFGGSIAVGTLAKSINYYMCFISSVGTLIKSIITRNWLYICMCFFSVGTLNKSINYYNKRCYCTHVFRIL